MANTVPLINSLTDNSSRSYLSVAEAAGAGTIRIQNINAFTAQHAIQVGETGQEKTEIVLLDSSAIAGTGLDLAGTLRYDHPADTPVYDINFNKAVFKVSTSGTAGTATAISSGTIDITPDSDKTLFYHSAGVSTDAYKVALYNSALDISSSDSDWLTPAGYPPYALGNLRQRIKDKLRSSKFVGDDAVIDSWINEWLESMTNAAIQVNEDYAYGTADYSFGTDGRGTITAENFQRVRRLWTTYDGSTYRESTYMPSTGFSPNYTFSSNYPRHYYEGDNVFIVKPEQSGGTARIAYYKLNDALVDDYDLLPVPMRGFSNSFVNYGLGQAYFKDKSGLGERFDAKAERSKQEFISQITPRDDTGPKTITFVEDLYL